MWFTENPWPPIIIVGSLGVVFGMTGMSRQQAKLYLLAGVCFAACVAIWVIERQIVTEGEKLEQRIHELADAFQRNELEQTLSHFSQSNPKLLATVAMAVASVDIEPDYRITDYEVSLKADDTLATTHFRVNVTANVVGHGHVGRQPTRWLVDWRIEGGEWKIVEVSRLKLVGPVTETIDLWNKVR
jgi:hypothetical protein